MRSVLKTELKKAFTGRMFQIALAIALALVLWHIILLYGFMHQVYLEAAVGRFTGQYNLFYWWLPIDCVSAPYAFFYGLFPLLACLPFSWSYYNERNTTYELQMITRCSKAKYFAAKYIAVYVSGGAVIALPLLLDFLLAALFSPAQLPNVLFSMPGYYREGFLTPLYYGHPWAFCAVVLFMSFLWAGTIASIGLLFAIEFRAGFFGVVMPTVAIYALDIIAGFAKNLYTVHTGKYLEFSPLSLLHTVTNNPNPLWLQIAIMAGMCMLSAAATASLAAKRDRI